jgi:hypothetical protein
MQAALVAVLARPAWWGLALASFLVRGGLLLVILPIVALPSSAGVTNALGPTIQRLILGRQSFEGILLGTVLVTATLAAVYALALAGAWLDLALLRETTTDDELDLRWHPRRRSAAAALGVRLLAHAPTAVALAYAGIRVVEVLYAELTSPGDTTTPLVVRVVAQVFGGTIAIGLTWLLGETVGGLVVRRVAAGESVRGAFGRSIRQVVSPRGLATLVVTTTALLLLLVPFAVAAGAAWAHARIALLDGEDLAVTFAALILLVSIWVLGLATLGALLAWRATAWTVQVAPRAVPVTQALLQASEPSS